MLKDSREGYGLISIVLHWVSAILVLGLFGLGLYMTSLSYYDTWYHRGPWWHVSFGVVLLLLTLIRLVWRNRNQTPAPLSDKRASHVLATSVKHLLYVALIAVMVSGYFINTAEGRPAMVFDWFGIPAITTLDADAVDLLGRIHLWGAWLIIGLVVMHVGGALLHQFVWRDRTLVRMVKPVSKTTL